MGKLDGCRLSRSRPLTADEGAGVCAERGTIEIVKGGVSRHTIKSAEDGAVLARRLRPGEADFQPRTGEVCNYSAWDHTHNAPAGIRLLGPREINLGRDP